MIRYANQESGESHYNVQYVEAMCAFRGVEEARLKRPWFQSIIRERELIVQQPVINSTLDAHFGSVPTALIGMLESIDDQETRSSLL